MSLIDLDLNERRTKYEEARQENIMERKRMFREIFGDEAANRVEEKERRLSRPARVAPRPRLSRRKVPAVPVRRSQRLIKVKEKKSKGFLGFPPGQFLRITKYEGQPITVDRVDDEDDKKPSDSDNMLYSALVFTPINRNSLPSDFVKPEWFGNGWKHGLELDSDAEVDAEESGNDELDDENNDPNYSPYQVKMESSEHFETKSPRKKRISTRCNSPPKLDVDDVTPELIENINYSSEKPRVGVCSTCHQCRQKTSDTKTVCRSGRCRGGRGVFCGYCLQRRYGEDVAVALKNPNWECPCCKGICNCSICRTRANLTPTGILYPLALHLGYKSVAEYLSIKEEETYKAYLA